MRTRITTLVLSGLTSAALVWGAGGTAAASPAADHSTASASAEAQGEWVDSLMREAKEGGTPAAGARTFASSSAFQSMQAARPTHRADGDTEPELELEAAPADGQEQDSAEPAGAALPDDSLQSGEPGLESERLKGQAPSTLPMDMGANGGKNCLHEPGHEHRGSLDGHGLGELFCMPVVPGIPGEHGEHGKADEHGEHCKHEKKCEHGKGEEHGEHCKPCEHGKPEEHAKPGKPEEHAKPGKPEEHAKPGKPEEHAKPDGQEQHQGQGQNVDVTVIVQNSVDNNVNNSAASNSNNSSENSSKNTALNLNKIKFVAEEVEEHHGEHGKGEKHHGEHEMKPGHHGEHGKGEEHHGEHEMKPGHHGEHGKGEEHHGGHHGELAQTGAPKTPVLLGLSAAFLAAGAAATRISRRRASQR
ncbi:hypothetical protein ACH4E7_23630 [Kitasatospora sp. NPDC018058]|uniref:hypothetical protein n=1 Tax=Kitasatospora sp. NPDC018058 TaxID=3364025 RepID=UPI0037C0E8C3